MQTQNILVKIKKSREGISYEALGIIEDTIEFHGMLDYQYKLKNLDVLTQLGLPPVLFSRVEKDVPYLFKDNPSSTTVTVQKDGHTEITRTVKIVAKPGQVLAVQMSEDFIPPDPPVLGRIDDHLDRIIQQLFKIRPFWCMKALKAQCTTAEELKKIVARHSYYFTSGPWRSLWVKFGVDPIQSREYAEYQILDLRLPTEWKEKISTRKSASSNPSKPVRKGKKETTLEKFEESVQSTEEEEVLDYVLDCIPSQMQVMYQICDIPLKNFDSLVSQTNGDFNTTTGWYKRNVLDKMRKEIKDTIGKWLKSGVSQNNLTEIQKLYREDAEREVANAPVVEEGTDGPVEEVLHDFIVEDPMDEVK